MEDNTINGIYQNKMILFMPDDSVYPFLELLIFKVGLQYIFNKTNSRV